jgi:hypothetical protein
VLIYDWMMLVRCNDNFVVKSGEIYALPTLLKYLMPPKKYQKEAAAKARKAMLAVRTAKQSWASVDNVNIRSGLAQNHDNESVPLSTIWKWEHYMHHWMDAYSEGLGAREAQVKVEEFSSTKYKSHCCIPDSVATTLDD